MMRRRIGVLLVIATVMAAVGAGVSAAKVRYWTLECSVDKPWRLQVEGPTGLPETVWVFTFKVTNPTDQTVYYVPQFTLTTETGKLYHSTIDYAAEATAERRLRRPLENLVDLIGDLKPGETREAIAVFPLPDPHADHYTLYVGGLSNQFKTITENSKETVVSKKLLYEYYRPGDAYDLHLDKVYQVAKRWVWR